MKIQIKPLVFIGLVALECKTDGIPTGTPACIINLIEQIKSQPVWNPPAQVLRYQYKGKAIYYIPQRCCDIPSLLIDENCQVLCSPDGGISGGGDGKCADFFALRSEGKLIWKDMRK